ncbi:armadillo repeat-containing protein 5 [Scleropages formosus]|uniref:Armadillo repeat containing 5 n=1 Tax=Scleropages formosus TaxID=113540 RepID=A0A8C9QQ01_SCLFO|nr:armadillo repeat-containing protein 5 [Scleropages formosus]
MENEKVAFSKSEASVAGPESSLSWCLSQLQKAESTVKGAGHSAEADAKESSRKARAALWRALVAIRTQHTKGGNAGVGRFRTRGGLSPLLKLLRRSTCDRKTLDLALSILANCCTESETRVEVRKLNGISVVVEILKNVTVETVRNRAARALGNLAIDPENSALIHSAGGVPLLLQCLPVSSLPLASPTLTSALSKTAQLECTQSAARALLYLSDTPSNRLSLLVQGAFPALAQLLAPEYPHALRRASLRALHELTKGCGVECAREAVRSGALTQLGDLALGGTEEPLAELALKILANLCSQGSLRPHIGSVGVIPKFVQEVKNDLPKSGLFFRALCLCCKEAVNRVKVKESGGLEVLMASLAVSQSHPFTRLAILAFVDFVYDEAALEHLQGLGLVSLLVARLVALAKGECSMAEASDTPSASSSSDPMSNSCFESFDFPPLEMSRKDEGGKEYGQESSSFLSLRSWLLSEGLISCEGELQAPSGSGEGEPGSSPATPLSDRLSLLTGLSTSMTSPTSCTPGLKSTSTSPCKQFPVSTSTPKSSLNYASVFRPTPPSPSKASSPKKKPRHILASSPTETPPTLKGPTYHHPYHPEPWTAESPILLLLSRFSQSVDPSSALINSGTISGLLYYLTHHTDPSSRCFRVLCRLSCNPNCLEGLVRTGSVALIWYRLCLQEGQEEKKGQTGRVKAKVRQLGNAVLNNLRVQGESSFGSGVLTHIMLSGSDTDKLYCTLALPLINRNKALLRKLLMDHGGLQLAFEALSSLGDDDDQIIGRWGALSSWLQTPQPPSFSHLCSLYFSLLTECLLNLLGCPTLELNMDIEFKSGSLPALSSPRLRKGQTAEPPPVKKQCPAPSCPYLDSKFDLIFLLDDSTQVPANTEAIAGDGEGEAGSEYFRALLRGGFWEARQNSGQRIPMKDVTSHMLLPVLHYLHGCSVSSAVEEEDQKADAQVRAGSGHCQILGALTCGVLRGWKQKRGMETDSYKEGLFPKTPLAEAMKGANMFLVSGLQRELEDLVVSVLLSLAGSQPLLPLPDTPSLPKGSDLPSLHKSQGRSEQDCRTQSVGESAVEIFSRTESEEQLSFEHVGKFKAPAEVKMRREEKGCDSKPESRHQRKPSFLIGTGCERGPDGQQTSQRSSALKSKRDGKACCVADDYSQLEIALGSWLNSELVFESDGKFGDVVSAAVDGGASDSSELQCASLWTLSPKMATKADCSLETLLNLRSGSGSKLLCRRDQRKNRQLETTTQLCHSSQCSFGSDLIDIYSDVCSCCCTHATPDAKFQRNLSQTSGRDSSTYSTTNQSSSDPKAARVAEPKAGKDARQVSREESVSAERPRLDSASDTGERSWPLGTCLPPLYRFAQLHGYTRLARTCLSVLLRPQRCSRRPPASVTADCLRQLAEQEDCVEGLKQDLLALAAQVLN